MLSLIYSKGMILWGGGYMFDEIANLVISLGLPIVCVIVCVYFIKQRIKAEREENQKREEKYIETIN